MTKSITGADEKYFGIRKADGTRIYITKPSFDCGWYWGFGYLGNSKEHYHLSSYANKDHTFTDSSGEFRMITEARNKNIHDCLLDDYDLTDKLKENLWVFCELVKTIYTLKETAEIYSRGGSHYTTNPCKGILKRKDLYEELTFKTLPEVLQSFWDLF